MPVVDADVVEHEHEVFRREIAAGRRSERRSAEPAERSVEAADAVLDREPRVHERRASRVVQVQPDVAADHTEHGRDPPRRRHPGGVGQRHPIDAGTAGVLDDRVDVVRRDLLTVERRAEAARDDLVEHRARRRRPDRLDLRLRLVDRHVHVLLAVRGRRRDRDREVVDSGRGRQLGALDVRHQRPQRDVVAREREPWPPTTSPAPAIAGTAFGETNAATSTSREPGSEQPLDQLDPACRLDGPLSLQPVPGRDVADLDRCHRRVETLIPGARRGGGRRSGGPCAGRGRCGGSVRRAGPPAG